MPERGLFLDIDHAGLAKHGQRVPGDIVLARRLEDGRVVAALSDGLGSGVKANVLATLTATVAVRHAVDDRDPRAVATVLKRTLPVCSLRQISYATFTLIDCDAQGRLRLIEYGNPPCLWIRAGAVDPLVTTPIAESEGPGRELKSATVMFGEGDRLVCVSDGVTQAGMGMPATPLGWGTENLAAWCRELLTTRPRLSAHALAQAVVDRAKEVDGGTVRDDTTCAVLHLRRPRRLLLITGAPYSSDQDAILAAEARNFVGRKVICGGTTADIIARELRVAVSMDVASLGSGLPPMATIPGFDLVTEGMLTLSKTVELLENCAQRDHLPLHGAGRLTALLLDSDIIVLRVGSRINQAHQNPTLPIELGIRRNLIRRFADVLTTRYAKRIELAFL